MTSSDPAVLDKVKEKETKLWHLLPGHDADSELEASGVLARDGWYYVVFDNHSTIACISARLDNAQDNRIAGRLCTDHGFEDITYNDRLQRYYTLVEARRHPCGDFCPQIEEYTDGFDHLETCWVNVTFKKKNKGLEGIVYVKRNGSDYVLGLCEGNRCVPPSLRFADYASLALRGNRLAVLSQKSAQLWIGRLDADRWEIVDEGALYDFSDDEKAYCNLEGIAWLDDTSFVVVSDRAKDKDSKCAKRDQSIHIFKLP